MTTAAITPKKEDHVQSLLSGSVVSALGMVVGGAVTVATGIVLARWLKPEGFGIYSVALVTAGFLGGIGTAGMDNTVARFVAYYEGKAEVQHVRSVVRFCLGRAVVAATLLALGLVIVLHGPAGRLGKLASLSSVQVYVIAAIPAVALQLVLWQTILGLQRLRSRIVLERILQPVLRLALPFLVFLILHEAVSAAVASIVAAAILGIAVAGLILRPSLKRFPADQRAGGPERREWWKFALPYVLYSLQNFVSQGMGIDLLLVSALASVRDSGIYAAAFRFTPLLVLARGALDYAFGPKIAFLWGRRDRAAIATLYQVSSTWALEWTLPGAAVLVLFAAPIMTATFGPAYAAGAQALAWLTLGFVADGATGCNTALLGMIGRPWLVMVNGFVGGVLTIVGCLVLVPRSGIVGAALAVSLARVASNALTTFEIWYEQGWQPFSGTTAKLAAAAGLAALCGFAWQKAYPPGVDANLLHLLPAIAVVLASYFVFVRLTGLSWRLQA